MTFILDLRWTLYIILLTGLAITGLFLGWATRRRPKPCTRSDDIASALERAPFGMLITDGHSRYLHANGHAMRLLGLEGDAGLLPSTAWTNALRQDCGAIWQEIATAGRYRVVALDDERWARWWVTALGEAEHPRYVVFLQDATAQHQAEQVANRLFSDLSHELRTPIATILTHLEVLRIPNLSDEQRRQSIELMQVEAQRMSRLVYALLELSRLQTDQETEHRPVDMLEVAEQAIVQMRPQAQAKNILLTLESHAPIDLILGDPIQIKQVLLNLLDNAIKYGRPGDRVTLSLQQQASGIDCAVCDTGPGIPAQHLPHITRRFYRGAASDREGLGLGLAIVQEILRRHQSDLHITSRSEGESTGTCVRFTLPRLPEEKTCR